ncbi:MAG: glutamyl-tRNA reductase [Acidobacteria bacterium]|nr:glutamyl-tRNA reductase [Acidobacteriota bacterium]
MTHLVLVGVSHHTAPVDLRERVDFSRRGLPAALTALSERPDIGEAVVLSTCNRAELYVTCADPLQGARALGAFICAYHELPPALVQPHVYEMVDEAAARHLFRVAAGLDSLVVGEPQILGQVKDAYSEAAERHFTGGSLNRLFHTAFTVGKRVRSETGLGEGAVSVSYAAVSLARKIFGSLKELTVLVIGAGEMGELTAKHLQAQQVRRIFVASRTAAHAELLANQVGGIVIAWQDFPNVLRSSDIVITATGSQDPILSRAHVEAAARARRHPLFLIDIAVPRDVEASAGDLEQVFLYNVDDLQTIVNENLARRAAEVSRAEGIVADEVRHFVAWWRSREVIPTMVALRKRFESIRRSELERLEPKIANLTPDARARVDEITRLIVEKLLLTPTEQLKSVADQETAAAYSDALSRLFSLAPPESVDEERSRVAVPAGKPPKRPVEP